MNSRFSLKRSYTAIIFYAALLSLYTFSVLTQNKVDNFTRFFFFLVFPYLSFFIFNSLFPRVYINKNKLYVRSEYFYSTSIRNIFITHVKTVSIHAPTEYSPQFWLFGWRTWLPSYRAGWLNLENQRPAFFAVSDFKNIVYIPTETGRDLLLSLEKPEEFIAALKEAHANS